MSAAGIGYADELAALLAHYPTKAQHVTLAVILGGFEDNTSKSTRCYPDKG
ncbi:hypothetical protein [Cryobacterium sp. Y50]|uniref:hypothetical protein n=1 Tax=Cryobacterium sp. Y50 TaxID=2048286 RepID=UPI001304BDA0|nr:hypothetical protein [Cryobacterium sp. Y50]